MKDIDKINKEIFSSLEKAEKIGSNPKKERFKQTLRGCDCIVNIPDNYQHPFLFDTLKPKNKEVVHVFREYAEGYAVVFSKNDTEYYIETKYLTKI